MAIRNSAEIGENLFKIANHLQNNDRLLRLLKYTDQNPFSKDKPEVDKDSIFQKNIKIVPIIKESDNDTESALAIVFKKGTTDSNIEFKNIYFDILVYVPLSEWILNDINLRPFLIMTEIEKSLKNKKIESIGTIDYSGFELELVTDIMSCYRMSFSIDVFN